MMGHFARDCRTRSKGEGKGKDEGKGYGKGKGKTMKGTERKGAGKSGRFKGERGEQNDRGYQGQCWSCGKIGHKSSECRWGVDNVDDDDDELGGSGSDRRVEINQSQRSAVMLVEYGPLGTWRRWKTKK